MSNASGSQASEIPNQMGSGVIFILHQIPLVVDDEIDLTMLSQAGPERLIPSYRESLADTYQPIVQFILESPLNMTGLLRAIYVTFQNHGSRTVFEVLPNAEAHYNPKGFMTCLDDLLSVGRVIKPGTDEETWRTIPNISTIFERLPANSCKLGVLSGPDLDPEMNDFSDFIDGAASDQTFVFVVGDFIGKEIEEHIDHYVKAWKLPEAISRSEPCLLPPGIPFGSKFLPGANCLVHEVMM